MASLLKASTSLHDAAQRAKSKGKGKGKVDENSNMIDGEGQGEVEGEVKSKMRKDKVLMLCSRGVTQRHRHLMRDLEVLLPHTKKGESSLSPVLVRVEMKAEEPRL